MEKSGFRIPVLSNRKSIRHIEKFVPHLPNMGSVISTSKDTVSSSEFFENKRSEYLCPGGETGRIFDGLLSSGSDRN